MYCLYVCVSLFKAFNSYVTTIDNTFTLLGLKKGCNYIFPRVTKNNRSVLPNSARGVTSFRKQFSEVCG